MTGTTTGARGLLVIAVDGPSAAGKGTLARGLARHFGLAFLDTGLLYRAVAARVLAAGQDPSHAPAAEAAAQAIEFAELEAPELRDDAVAQAASKVAALPAVRAALLGLQRRFAAVPPPGPAAAISSIRTSAGAGAGTALPDPGVARARTHVGSEAELPTRCQLSPSAAAVVTGSSAWPPHSDIMGAGSSEYTATASTVFPPGSMTMIP